MTPTMRQLEALVLVYRHGSLTKAAAELRVTQSAVSLLIRQIEENFQLRLFDRTTRALHPTLACRDAVPIAERILAGASGLGPPRLVRLPSMTPQPLLPLRAAVPSLALLPRNFTPKSFSKLVCQMVFPSTRRRQRNSPLQDCT